MVIDARQIFSCAHSYVVVKHRGTMVFACMTCSYRTEELPIRSKVRAPHVVSFPAAAGADRLVETITKTG